LIITWVQSLERYTLFKIYPVYSVAGCHKGYRLQQVGLKFYVIQLYGKCITLYLLVTLSNLFFVILFLVIMTVHLRIYISTPSIQHTHSHFQFHIQPLLIVALFRAYMHATTDHTDATIENRRVVTYDLWTWETSEYMVSTVKITD
jgi:hypothetical protein